MRRRPAPGWVVVIPKSLVACKAWASSVISRGSAGQRPARPRIRLFRESPT